MIITAGGFALIALAFLSLGAIIGGVVMAACKVSATITREEDYCDHLNHCRCQMQPPTESGVILSNREAEQK